MHMGQQLTVLTVANPLNLWTPWMSRGGDYAQFCYEVIAKLGNPSFTVDGYHKASEDLYRDGTSLSFVGSWTSTSVGNSTFYTITSPVLKEMIRFKLTLTASSTTPETLVFRFHEPTWFNKSYT